MKKSPAFSLLELLVALALLAVIGAGLAGAMRLGTETFSRAQNLDGFKAQISARAQLRRFLARATAPSISATFPTEMSGTNVGLTFVTLSKLGSAIDAAGTRVTISSEDLLLVYTLETLSESGQTMEAHKTRLAENAMGLKISYFFDGTWQDEWTNPNALPLLISIGLDPGSEPHWPDFTVKLIHAN